MAQHDTILFVTMDGEGTKSSAIRAHAARKGHQKSREKAAKSPPIPGSSSSTSDKADQSSQKDPVSKAKARRRNTANATGAPPFLKPKYRKTSAPQKSGESSSASKSSTTDNQSKEQQQQQDQQQQLVPAHHEKQSPYQIWIPSCMSDRFIAMFFETMLPSYTAAYDVFNVPNIIKQEWPLYMNHEVFLWTEAAAIQGLYESLQNPTKPPSQKVLLYKAKALQCLKQELLHGDGKLDDYLIMSIFVLASLDLMAGDDIAHNAHKKMLRTAFATAGGLHTYGSFVRNTTMRLDSFWRSTADEPTTPAVPRLQPSRAPRLPSHPFSAEICTLIGMLPEGFQELALQRKLPLDVLEVLGRLADPSQKPLTMSPSNADNRSPVPSSSSSNPASQCGMYLDFWESCPSLESRPTSGGEPHLERLLGLALLIYATNREAANPLRMYNCITNGAIYDLCHDLPLCERRRERNEEHCLYWIWSVAVDATRDRFGNLSPAGQALLDAQKERFPGIVGTRGEEAVLKRFWFEAKKSSILQPEIKKGTAATYQGGFAVPGPRGHSDNDPGSPGSSWQMQSSMEESGSSFSVQTPRTDAEVYGNAAADYMAAGGAIGAVPNWQKGFVEGQWSQSEYGYVPVSGYRSSGSVSGQQLTKIAEEVPELPYGEKKTGRREPGVIRAVVG